ncbi:1893_t:CDS:1, partial [Paraglomus brasilianum]
PRVLKRTRGIPGVLVSVKYGIFVRTNCWNNPVLRHEFEGSLNEGTYMSTVIMPAIQAALKGTPFIISCGERQSCASADRKGGKRGRKPDIMVEVRQEKTAYWLRKSCKPQKGQFV